MIDSCLIKSLWCLHFACFTLFRPFKHFQFLFPTWQIWRGRQYICCNHELILFEYFETVGRNVLDSEQRNRLPDSPKRQVTSLARISNLLVACRVKYSSSKTEAFPYLVFQGIDDTGRITDTRRHTYDPITFRMQITPSNHELEAKISSYFSFFDPVRPCIFLAPWHHPPHSSLSVRARLFLPSSTISVTVGINRERGMRIADFFSWFACGCSPRGNRAK